VSILLLGVGGGGGNILRSLKALFRRDVEVIHKADARYADRLRRAITPRFLDTNAFSLSNVPREERLLIGPRTTGQLGARHNPDVAREALEESRDEVDELLKGHSLVIAIGTGGKGTGAGTMFPIARRARELGKLVIPIFVRPSFERHEVDKRRFDHALAVVGQFDNARIRLIEILNDQGYTDSSPQPQSVVWERMNLPIARGLRGLIYVLSDLSQVDPSDLSMLFAGPGRLRLGFSEIDPSPSDEPSEQQVEHAIVDCWQNRYYAFDKPVGTSLICIQGDWSNVVDARLKGGLATLAAGRAADSRYTPLFARAPHAPKPWGVTALFAEYTGDHEPLTIDWTIDKRISPLGVARDISTPPIAVAERVSSNAPSEIPLVDPAPHERRPHAVSAHPAHTPSMEPEPPQPGAPFATLWEFAVAVNRGHPAALALAADSADADLAVGGGEVRKLLGTVWFRAVLPLLSPVWRERILRALVESASIPNHILKVDRRDMRLSDLGYERLKDLFAKSHVPDAARADVHLLLTVARFWGPDALGRFEFAGVARDPERSRFASALLSLRR
jgi:cell division GTPase FtsZ